MRLLISALFSLALATSAAAQTKEVVHFDKGTSGATMTGKVTGHDYVDYVLGAGKGQLMIASLEVTGGNGDGTAYFNILPPGSQGEAIWIGNMEADQIANVTLPAKGDYTLRVYLMGNDEDAGKTVNYALHVNIQ